MHTMETISRAFEWIAIAVLILAFFLTLVGVARDLRNGASAGATYRRGREIFGRGILVGLEVLVAADLIRTLAVQPTLENIGVLGLIVVVRILLGFALDIEIDGVLPWRKRESRAFSDHRP
jgi:uncharacterized membrane protein